MSDKEITFLHRRALLLLAGASVFVAGCSNIVGPPASPQTYVLKPVLPDLTQGSKVKWGLNVDEPGATEALDSERITISRSANTLDTYADVAWTDHLPELIQQALVDAFERSGRIDQVATDDKGLEATYLLQSDLRECVARYDQPDGAPTASVRMEVRLVTERGRTIVGRMAFSAQQAATQNSVDAAVEALDGALGQVLGQIVNWTLATGV